jgi:hypothetical protein
MASATSEARRANGFAAAAILSLFGCIKDRATLRTDLIQVSDHAIPDLSTVGNVGGAEAQGVAHARLPLDSLTRPGLSKGWRDRCAQ